MLKLLKNPMQRMFLFSIISLIFSLMVVMVVGFAWFSIQRANVELVNVIGDIDGRFELYVYIDSERKGNSFPNLNECAPNQDKCYLLVYDGEEISLEDIYIFGSNNKKVFPGERFSFAMKVTNDGSLNAYMDIEFNRIASQGHNIALNKIQRSFRYSVTRIVYLVNGVEGFDIKNQHPIQHYSQLFNFNINDGYLLTSKIPIGEKNSNQDTVIIYFDLMFDPNVTGYNVDGTPTNNSNPYQNQTLSINEIKMVLYKQ